MLFSCKTQTVIWKINVISERKTSCPNVILTVKSDGDNVYFSIMFNFTINFIADVLGDFFLTFLGRDSLKIDSNER